jgi:hypothetical protein
MKLGCDSDNHFDYKTKNEHTKSISSFLKTYNNEKDTLPLGNGRPALYYIP